MRPPSPPTHAPHDTPPSTAPTPGPTVAQTLAALSGPWGLGLAGLALVAWDASGLDMPLAQWFGDARGFALRDHPWLTVGLHEGVRKLGWVLLLGLTTSIVWPVGWLRRLSRAERAWMVGGIWLAIVVVALLKGISRTSCPWDLAAFGGTAQHVSHWLWWVSDGGPGHCFPGGHASTAFAFLPLAWWRQRVQPLTAWRWAAVIVLCGLLLGLVQQVRGAHFLSHNLWTGWLCWATAWGMDRLSRRFTRLQ